MLRARSVVLRALPLTLVLLAGSGCAKTVWHNRVNEFRNPDIPGNHFKVIAIGPVDPRGYDISIAERVRDHLRKEGVSVVTPPFDGGDGEATMVALCSKQGTRNFEGVAFVSYDRIILRECENHAVAFQVEGGYIGVDELTRRLLRYLRDQSERSR